MSEIKLSPIPEDTKEIGISTSSMIGFAIRDHDTDEEYDLGYRLSELRKAAFDMAVKLREEGYDVPVSTLRLIDVIEPAVEAKRHSY